MRNFLKFGIVALVVVLTACSSNVSDGSSGSGSRLRERLSQNNSRVTIKSDGTTTTGVKFSVIDQSSFFLDHIKYQIVDCHLEIIGYDPVEIAEDVRPYATVIHNGIEYKTRVIQARAFIYCDKMKSIAIPSTVIEIGEYAFYCARNLAAVVLPSRLAEIGKVAFKYCESLTSVACYASTSPYLKNNHYPGYDAFCGVYETAVLYVPAASVKAYRATDGWKKFETISPL